MFLTKQTYKILYHRLYPNFAMTKDSNLNLMVKIVLNLNSKVCLVLKNILVGIHENSILYMTSSQKKWSCLPFLRSNYRSTLSPCTYYYNILNKDYKVL